MVYFKNTLQSFFWGIITAGISLLFQLIIISFVLNDYATSPTDQAFLGTFIFLIIYALTEESFKYLIVFKKILPLSYGKGFLFNAWIGGLGFSLLEAYIIYQKNIYEHINFDLLDVVKTAPLHILTFGTLGYFLAIQENRGLNFKILSFNFIIHLIYNYSIIYLENYSRPITLSITILLIIINFYGFLIVNKKLASNE